MDSYAGVDVYLEASSVCLVDSAGKIIRETKVASDPDALIEYFVSLGLELKQIGLEAGPLSQWLYEGLTKAGFDVVLLETRHVKAALSAMTDRKDARGILRDIKVTPRVAQNTTNRHSTSTVAPPITSATPSVSASANASKRYLAGPRPAAMRKTRHRAKDRVGWMFTLTSTAYNLVRLPKLLTTA